VNRHPLRMAIVGAGGLGTAHAAAIERHPELATLVAAVDPVGPALSRFLADRPGVTGFASIEEALATTEIDAAVVATPHVFHAPQILALVEAGAGVVVEKPAVISTAEMRSVIAAQEGTGVPIVVGQTKRFLPGFRPWRERIRSEADGLGALRSAQIVSMQDLVGLLAAGLGRWFANGALAGGGAAISHGIHVLDAVRYLTGLDYVRVSAAARYDEPMTGGAESDLVATLELDGGALATFDTSYRAVGHPHGELIVLLYDAGGLTYTWDTGLTLRRRVDDPVVADPADPGVGDPFEAEFLHLVDLLAGEPVVEICSPRDNFNTIATIEALMRSARERRPVTVEVL
jgi:predicted dehydrogenase